MTQTGRVVASHGRHVWIEDSAGNRRICHPRGKKNQAVVGDLVQWLASEDEGSIEAIEPRRNLFYRQDDVRTKSFAANLDQVLVLVAADPEFSESQVARALIAAEQAGIRSLIALNKQDLSTPFEKAWTKLKPYRDFGCQVLPLGLRNQTDDLLKLKEALQGRITLVLGPSGAGNSTLINRLVPQANAATNIISKALHSGKHTTTAAHLYHLDAQSQLIDSPGLQEFGLHHLSTDELEHAFIEFRPHLGLCRFSNCKHTQEPDCAIKQAVLKGKIGQERLAIYQLLRAEIKL